MTGAAATVLVVKTAADGTGASAAATIATSSAPPGLSPAATPPARNPDGAVTPPGTGIRVWLADS